MPETAARLFVLINFFGIYLNIKTNWILSVKPQLLVKGNKIKKDWFLTNKFLIFPVWKEY
jgi:hypothetical protein